MSHRIHQAIVISATGIALIGGMTGMASAAFAKAAVSAPHIAAMAETSQAKPCQQSKDCRRGYADGYEAGRLSCKNRSARSHSSRGFGQYQRGFELGYERARDRYC